MAREDRAARPHGSYLIKHTPLRLRETAVSPNTFRQTESWAKEETKEHISKPNKETYALKKILMKEISNQPDKEFKVTVIKIFLKLRSKMSEYSEILTKMIKNIRKY